MTAPELTPELIATAEQHRAERRRHGLTTECPCFACEAVAKAMEQMSIALTERIDRGAAAATLGRAGGAAGTGASKRRAVDYREIGRRGLEKRYGRPRRPYVFRYLDTSETLPGGMSVDVAGWYWLTGVPGNPWVGPFPDERAVREYTEVPDAIRGDNVPTSGEKPQKAK